jgi:hypothetical protein
MRLMVLMYVYEQVLRRVQWKGQKDWLLSAPGTWAQDGKPAGFVRAHQNLEYLIGKLISHSCVYACPYCGISSVSKRCSAL